MLIATHDFDEMRALVNRRCGLVLDESRRHGIEAHVARRMDALGMARFVDYLRFLALGEASDEYRLLINAVTVNETFFFRDYRQLTAFGEPALDEVLQRKDRDGSRSLRLLSAGCATGEEPYSLAIILREMIDDIDAWDVRIDALDINTDVLDAAWKGVYGPRSTRDVPISYRLAHFTDLQEGLAKVRTATQEMVRFHHGNILDPTAMARHAGMDFVFCRNVLIYFDDAARRRALATFHDLLRPGGYVFLGYAETVNRFSGAFEMRRFGDTICHRKPLVPGTGEVR